jgi:hypothetical protein
MSMIVSRAAIYTRETGEEVRLTEKEIESLRDDNTYVITCDGPRCASNHAADEAVFVVLNDEQSRKNAEAVPDEFFRFIKVQPVPNEDKLAEFCSRKCLTDYLVYAYVLPQSPREKAEQLKNNQQVDAQRAADVEPVSQADGEAI